MSGFKPSIALLSLMALAPPVAGVPSSCPLDLIYGHNFDSSNSASTRLHNESFNLPDASSWPATWTATGGVNQADVLAGAARLRPNPSNYSLARMHHPVSNSDAEARFTIRFNDIATQGIGFYLRQDGSYLDPGSPHGGYAVFLEGSFRGSPGISLWKEADGSEQELLNGSGAVPPPQAGVDYRVRFRVHQQDPTHTRLQAKMWPLTDPEPAAWQVSVLDDTAALQQFSGGIAVDSWSSLQNPPIDQFTHIDDIEIEALCNPLENLPAVELVSESFQFTEGPVWRGDHLLFSDINGNTIYRLDPPSGVSVFRTPSNRSNGLLLNGESLLLAAEHQSRRVSLTLAGGAVTTLIDNYLGDAFNSPNDLALASDGSLYFTDPSYGLSNPNDRELPFNGLFRRRPDGSLVAEWMGAIGVNEPNGVLLSPDQTLLYFSDTQSGTLRVFDVDTVGADPGALSNLRTLISGLSIADGMCMDSDGNVYVTVASGVRVYAPDGAFWGEIPVPRNSANCTFGGSDGRTLYITARQGLYRLSVNRPGLGF